MSLVRLYLDQASAEQRADEAMVELCCEDLEGAITAGVMKVNPIRGTLYLRAPGRYWSVRFCPFCRRPRESIQRGTRADVGQKDEET